MEYYLLDQYEGCIQSLDEGYTSCGGNYVGKSTTRKEGYFAGIMRGKRRRRR